MSASLIDHFSSLEDPRIERNKRHALLDILVLVVSAVCSNESQRLGGNGRFWTRQAGLAASVRAAGGRAGMHPRRHDHGRKAFLHRLHPR
ncbi:transposase family protein [Candidatus Thiothrix anitrata]